MTPTMAAEAHNRKQEEALDSPIAARGLLASLLVFSASLAAVGCGTDSGGADAAVDANEADAAIDATAVDAVPTCFWLTGNHPDDGATDIPLTTPGGPNARILLQFSKSPAAETISRIHLEENGVEVADISTRLGADDPTIVEITVPGGYASSATCVLTIPAGPDGLRSSDGLELCHEEVITFTTTGS